MALAKRCDRCGRPYDCKIVTNGKRQWEANAIGLAKRSYDNRTVNVSKLIDLCPCCLAELDIWLSRPTTDGVNQVASKLYTDESY